MSSGKEERPFYIPKIDVENDLKTFGMSPTKRNLEFGPNIAILVIDMSPIFVEGILFPKADKEVGWRAVKAIKKLLDEARPLKVPVIYTTGYVFKTDSERGAWMYRFTDEQREMVSSFDNESLHQIVEQIAPQDNEVVILKAKPSGFFGTQLLSILNHDHIDTLIITGMATGGCVRATDSIYGDVRPLSEVVAELKKVKGK
jgi:nicotinamidase-related amidase